MAISGVADADVESAARTYAKTRKEMAAALGGYAYQTKSATTADHGGGSHQVDVTWANLHGLVTVEWGDGTRSQYNGSAGAATHVYAGAGTYTVILTSSGNRIVKAPQVIA